MGSGPRSMLKAIGFPAAVRRFVELDNDSKVLRPVLEDSLPSPAISWARTAAPASIISETIISFFFNICRLLSFCCIADPVRNCSGSYQFPEYDASHSDALREYRRLRPWQTDGSLMLGIQDIHGLSMHQPILAKSCRLQFAFATRGLNRTIIGASMGKVSDPGKITPNGARKVPFDRAAHRRER